MKRGRSWTEVSSNCRVGLIIEMSVAAFVSESLGTSAGPAGMELLLNTIYFLKHLDQQELALCLGNLFCFACLTSPSSDTADGIHVHSHRQG